MRQRMCRRRRANGLSCAVKSPHVIVCVDFAGCGSRQAVRSVIARHSAPSAPHGRAVAHQVATINAVWPTQPANVAPSILPKSVPTKAAGTPPPLRAVRPCGPSTSVASQVRIGSVPHEARLRLALLASAAAWNLCHPSVTAMRELVYAPAVLAQHQRAVSDCPSGSRLLVKEQRR